MAKKPRLLLQHERNTSWLPALITLIAVCLLPLIIIKVFHYHPKQLGFNALSISVIPPAPTPSLETAAVRPPPPLPQNPTEAMDQTIRTQQRDTLAKIFKRLSLSAKELHAIASQKPQSALLTRIKPNQTMIFTIKDHHVEKLVYAFSPIEDLVITRDNHQHYVGVRVPKKTTPKYQTIKARLQGSLYRTAKRHGIPQAILQQFTAIFSRDVDFKKGMRHGDQFSILYKANFIDHTQIGQGEILAASYTKNGVTHEAIRYTNRDGSSNYYTPQGLSLKKGYDRYPIRFSHIASPFSLSRYHPILHYRRPHYGIDLAAPAGTPIHAIGDGRIEVIHRESGYGNMIKIHHNDMYCTIYGHLSRFEKGLYKGKMVKRGQVIGYVGQTGLASGPHCHFEFHINQQPKNPTTIALPHADPIPHREMGSFKHRVNQLLAALHHPHSSLSRFLHKKDTSTA